MKRTECESEPECAARFRISAFGDAPSGSERKERNIDMAERTDTIDTDGIEA